MSSTGKYLYVFIQMEKHLSRSGYGNFIQRTTLIWTEGNKYRVFFLNCLEQGGHITEGPKSYYGVLLRVYYGLLRILRVFYYGYYGGFLYLNQREPRQWIFKSSQKQPKSDQICLIWTFLITRSILSISMAIFWQTFYISSWDIGQLYGRGHLREGLRITDITEYYGYYGISYYGTITDITGP